MTDIEFLDEAEKLLRHIEVCCDRIDEQSNVDIDCQRNGGVLTLVFSGGAQIVINLQKPLHEVWLASRCGGYHYRFTEGAWHSTKGGDDFYTQLSRHASEQAGAGLIFSAV